MHAVCLCLCDSGALLFLQERAAIHKLEVVKSDIGRRLRALDESRGSAVRQAQVLELNADLVRGCGGSGSGGAVGGVCSQRWWRCSQCQRWVVVVVMRCGSDAVTTSHHAMRACSPCGILMMWRRWTARFAL